MPSQCGFDLYCKPQPIPYQSDQPIPRYGYCARLEGVRNFQNDLIESKIQMLEVVSGEMRDQLGRKPFNNKQPHSHISNANNDIITEDTYNAFQMDDSNNMWAQGGYYGFLAGNAGITGGGAKEGSIFTTKNQMKWSECEPPCSHQFCLDNPRAICSAKNILRPYEMCGSGDGGGGGGGGNQCVHTSCLACGYEPDTSFCGQCEDPTDQKCMNKFGKCVKTMRRVTRKDPQSYIKQGLVSYECAVPECTNVNNYLK
ncbi:uncharacterized protein LOC142336583 [Convolutriloba macropyga]|uniref:uncharacterized protein LOC142336583 n=1 Tax=Convolutriloba macropyga TaxID=536237 RepID=UPI003F52006E